MNNQEIREEIFKLKDEKYKEFHSSLCPNTDNIIGVRVPNLRKLAKKISKKDFDTYLKNAQDEYYEEKMLQGMVIGLAKIDFKQTSKYLTNFIPKIDNWAVCDTTAAGLKITNNYKTEMWNFLETYLKSKEEFELRFVIVMMLDFYITEEYVKDVLQILNQIKHDGYYVKMAIAWAISVAFIKFPAITMNFLKNNSLDDFTYNKALQKIVESYRVDKKTKDEIRKMKK